MNTSYAYHAIDLTGRRVRGVEDGKSEAAIFRSLAERGLVVIEVEPASENAASHGGSKVRRPAGRDVLQSTQTMAGLLDAGVPLVRTLTIAGTLSSHSMRGVLDAVRQCVERGEDLSEALGRHSKAFSPVYVGVVRAGERSGDLASALRTLSLQLEREDQLRSRLISASIYPLILMLVGITAVCILFLAVLPRFAEILTSTGSPIPRSTKMLLDISNELTTYWFWLLMGVGAIAAALVGLRRSVRGVRLGYTLLLRLPIVGTLRRELLGARLARMTSVLVGGGSPILSALQDVERALQDPIAKDELSRVRGLVRDGNSLTSALAGSQVYPRLLSQLTSVGEEVGNLGGFLERAALILESRVDQGLQRLVTLVEPAMIVLLGGLVGFVGLSIMQAIYGVNPSFPR